MAKAKDAGIPPPTNVPDPVNYAPKAFSDSWGGGVPIDRSKYPATYFTNPPIGRNSKNSARTDTGDYTFPMAGKLFRGWIQEADLQTDFAPGYKPSPDPSRVYRCNFHFNPSDVTMDWEVQTPTFDPVQSQNAANANIGVYQTQGVTFGLNLLFDREGDFHPLVRGWGGVNADIRILNAILTSGSQQLGQLTYASPAPVKCVIGRTYAGANASNSELVQSLTFGGLPVAYPLGITGLMSSMSVDYQRFDASMTPTRAVVQISIQVLTYMPASGTAVPIKPIPPPRTSVGFGGAGSLR